MIHTLPVSYDGATLPSSWLQMRVITQDQKRGRISLVLRRDKTRKKAVCIFHIIIWEGLNQGGCETVIECISEPDSSLSWSTVRGMVKHLGSN